MRGTRRRGRGNLASRVAGALLIAVAMSAAATGVARPAAALSVRPGTASATVASTTSAAASDSCPWLNQDLPVAERVRLLMSQMTLADKIQMMYDGEANGYENGIPAQPSLCIPALISQDRPESGTT